MAAVEVVGSGLLYANPKPHVRSVHAYFPSVVVAGNAEMLATVVLGEAFEAANLRTHVCRSGDGGATWEMEGPLCRDAPHRLTSDSARLTSESARLASDSARLTALPDGTLTAFLVRHDRSEHPDEGLTNPATLGFVPTELALVRSTDHGHTWSGPCLLEPPLEGPCFELCSPIVVLRDGRWVLPTSTWPDWNGRCPNGVKMGAFVSSDRGETWRTWWDVMHEPEGRVFFWESKIVELTDGRLLAVAWVYDDAASRDRPNHYALSEDGGASWSLPASTGLQGQTMAVSALDDGRLLCAYRRMDTPGLWAQLARLDGARWVNDEAVPLWGAQTSGLTAASDNMAHNFNVLRFGAPCLTPLPDGAVFLAFWCYEERISVIRWFKLALR